MTDTKPPTCGAPYLPTPGVRPSEVYHCRLDENHDWPLHVGRRPADTRDPDMQTEAVWPVDPEPTAMVVDPFDDHIVRVDALNAGIRWLAIEDVSGELAPVTIAMEHYLRTGAFPEDGA